MTGGLPLPAQMTQFLRCIPGLAPGLCLCVLGALLIPVDPFLHEASRGPLRVDVVKDGAMLITRSANCISVVALLAVVVFFGGPRRWRIVAAALVAAGVAAIACDVLKNIIGRGRPDAWSGMNVFIPFSPATFLHSFPSGHAANAVVVAMFIALAAPKSRVVVAVWAVAVGLSRALLRRHFVGDVIEGFGVGMCVSAITLAAFGLTGPRPGPTSLHPAAPPHPPRSPSSDCSSSSPRP